eukprot:scaffold801_cov46-Cyclotella_meneghiniana.AAC.2
MYPSGTLAEEDEERGFGMDGNNGTEEPFKGVERRDNINISIEHHNLISDCPKEPAKVKFKPISMGRIVYAARGASATSSVESSRSLFGGLSRHNSTAIIGYHPKMNAIKMIPSSWTFDVHVSN